MTSVVHSGIAKVYVHVKATNCEKAQNFTSNLFLRVKTPDLLKFSNSTSKLSTSGGFKGGPKGLGPPPFA
jgi:hypothetical protein